MSDRVVVDGSGNLATTGLSPVVWRTNLAYFGVIDDFRMFSTVPSEATALSRARRELDDDEALAALVYIQFSEGTGDTAFDTSGNDHDATRLATAQWVGLEGGAELVGVRKPRVWGVKRRRAGKKIDAQRLVWQVNAGPTSAIAPTESGASTLTYDGDYADIYDWTPVAGRYATQLSEGLVRFQTEPVRVAFDVWGDVDPEWGYTAVTGHIMRALMVRQGGLSAIDEVDLAALAALAASRPDDVGVATGDQAVTVAALLNRLAEGVDGWWLPERGGRVTVGLRTEPGDPEIQLSADDVLESGVRRAGAAAPVYQWSLSFRDYEVTVAEEDVSGLVPAARRADLGRTERIAETNVLEQVRDRHREARQARGATNYDTRRAARLEAERRLAIDRYKRQVYQVPLASGLFQYRVGQSLSLALDRFSLGGGWPSVVYGYDEEPEQNRAVLYLWGRHVPDSPGA